MIFDHNQQESPKGANRIDALISSSCERLLEFPQMGVPGLLPNTRELFPHPSYRLVYRTDIQTVINLFVVHTARSWPPVDKEPGPA